MRDSQVFQLPCPKGFGSRIAFSSYVGSSYGWDPRSKKKELFHAESRFILVHQTEAPGLLIAYTMFRFDDEETMEDGVMEPVVYWSVLPPTSFLTSSNADYQV